MTPRVPPSHICRAVGSGSTRVADEDECPASDQSATAGNGSSLDLEDGSKSLRSSLGMVHGTMPV